MWGKHWIEQTPSLQDFCLRLKFAHLLTTPLCLSVENGYGICVRSSTSSLKSTLIMTASHGDISVHGSLSAQKEQARLCLMSSLEPGPTWLLIVLATQYDKEPGGAGFEASLCQSILRP